MKPTIASLMSKDVCCVNMDDTVESVEARMNERRLHWVPVVESNGTAMGVISASDILRFHASKRDPSAINAWQICSYKPVSVPIDAALDEVARTMVDKNVHHVVVVEGGSIRGVVSSMDFVRSYIA